jgi:lipoprotein-releasing system permease protein
MTTTWKERHSGLLEWLTLYDIPIKLIMIFITAVGIFNIAASLWMIIIEKTRDFGIMKSMGLCANNIQRIIIKEGAYIGLSGAFGGIVLSVIILYLQITYQFIKLSNDIYFMDYLPVKMDPIYFIYYPLIAFFITIAFSYYPAKRASRISPAEALRYE